MFINVSIALNVIFETIKWKIYQSPLVSLLTLRNYALKNAYIEKRAGSVNECKSFCAGNNFCSKFVT